MDNLLILDLDETLVFANDVCLDYSEDFKTCGYFVYKRPFLEIFINTVRQWFQIAVWTSSDKIYAHQIVKNIFPKDYPLEFVLTNDDCTTKFDFELQEYYQVKKLKKLKKKGYSLDKVLIIDDTPKKAEMNYGNYIRINAFEGDRDDNELMLLLEYLPKFKSESNIRKIEKRFWRTEVSQPRIK